MIHTGEPIPLPLWIANLNKNPEEYEVVGAEVIGSGGFGITYKIHVLAHQRTLNYYAVKEYFPDAIAERDEETGEVIPTYGREDAFEHGKMRFIEEAELLMKMSGKVQVAKVYDWVEANNTAYYFMEFLDGVTAKQLFRQKGGLTLRDAKEIAMKAGMALEEIHTKIGIFHRDVSPENIMLMPNGEIRIIDFGSAKAMAVKENQHFTIVLKPGYAPPEQYTTKGEQGSFTDVYALAGTFYYLATGKMIPAAPDRLMGATYEPMCNLLRACNKEVSDAVDAALNLNYRMRTQTAKAFVEGIMLKPPGKIEPAKPPTSRQEEENVTVRVDPELLEDPIQTMRQGCVQVIAGACLGETWPLFNNREMTLGSSAVKSQIILKGHPELSRLHCKISYDPEKNLFYITDESLNGTVYQNVRLEKGKRYRAKPDSIFTLGGGRLRIRLVVNYGKNRA